MLSRYFIFHEGGTYMANTQDSSTDSTGYEGYVLPAENAAEMARLMIQDRLITQAMGGVAPELSSFSQVHRALDVACGPGGWLLDLVTQYPHVQGVGIDVSQLMIEYASSLARTQGLAGVQFHVMNATQPLNFPDSTFDLVNGRILVGFLFKHHWPKLLAECARITRPGGMLRLTEAEWGFTTSPALDTLMNFLALALYRAGHSFSPHGRTIGTANVLRLLMRQAGYQNIQSKAYAVDYSAGTEAHESNMQNMLIVFKLFQPFFIQIKIATQEELDHLHQQMEEEMQAKDFCAVDYFLTVWGERPIDRASL